MEWIVKSKVPLRTSCVGAHPGVLAYTPYAGPALVCFPILAENQVGIERHLPWAKSQRENGIGQKKKSALIQPFRVSVFDFRGVTSQVIFQNFTPKFVAMSIEKSDFTACSQV